MQKGYAAAPIALTEEHAENNKEPNVLAAIDFVSRGGELLKRTRKGNSSFDLKLDDCKICYSQFHDKIIVDAGDLHWKLVSINLNSDWQVQEKLSLIETWLFNKMLSINDK